MLFDISGLYDYTLYLSGKKLSSDECIMCELVTVHLLLLLKTKDASVVLVDWFSKAADKYPVLVELLCIYWLAVGRCVLWCD